MSALVAGILAYIVWITNFYVNNDSISGYYYNATQTDYSYLGRWFAKIINSCFCGEIQDSMLFTYLGIAFIALSAALIVSIFHLESSIVSGLVGVSMVVFPSVVCTNTYILTSVTFFAALILSVLSIYYIDKSRKSEIFAVVCMVLSLALYQAYIGVAAGLLIMKLMIDIIVLDEDILFIIKKSIKYLCFLAVSVIIYYIILRLVMFTGNVQLSSYRGIDNMTSIQINQIPNYIIEGYKKVVRFFYLDAYGENTLFSAILYRLLVIAGIANICMLFLKRQHKAIGKIIYMVGLILVFPIAIHAVAVLGQNANTHWLMIYSFVLVAIFVLLLIDYNIRTNTENIISNTKINSFVSYASLIICIVVCYQWIQVTGECYTYIKMTDSNVYANAIQIASSLNQNGYTGDTPLAIVGDADESIFESQVASFDKTQYTGVVSPDYVVIFDRLHFYMQRKLEYKFMQASSEEVDSLSNLEQVIAMPVYPEMGSICEINGITVLKLSEIEVDYAQEISVTDETTLAEEKFGAQDITVDASTESHQYMCETIDMDSFVKSNCSYQISWDSSECLNGTADVITVGLYYKPNQELLLETETNINEPFKWAFNISKYFDELGTNDLDILIYAGKKGQTAGNTIICHDVRIDQIDGIQ